LNLWWKLIKFGFRLLYNELAFTYDTVSYIVSLGAWRCWHRASIKILPDSSNGIILEIAHGTGDLQIDLKNAGYQTIGYDLSPNMGRIAQRKLSKAKLSESLLRGKAQELPFSSGIFPAVVTTFPTAFIIAPATLKEIHRVLVPDGTLIIVSSGTFIGGGILRAILEWLYRITGQRNDPTLTDEYLAYFAPFGFTVTLHTAPCPRSYAQVITVQKTG
jgi:ubiquinone/menaquinone biosynthesis C-methylase UbiE